MDLRTKRTKALLSQAMLEMIHEVSFDSIHVSELCERAMVGRGTFYRYFNSKDDLLKHLVTERYQSHVADIVSIEGELDLPAYCVALVGTLLDLVDMHSSELERLRHTSGISAVTSALTSVLSVAFSEKLASCRNEVEPGPDTMIIAEFFPAGILNVVKHYAESNAEGIRIEHEQIEASIAKLAQACFSNTSQ